MLIKLPSDVRKELTKTGNFLNFYKALGWNPATNVLDPAEVQMNPKYTGKLLKGYTRNLTPRDVREYMQLWLGYGPAASSTVKPRHARVGATYMKRYIRANHPDWIVEDELVPK